MAMKSTEFKHRSPIDLVHLSRQTLGDRDLEREVLELFVNQSRLYLQRLEVAKSVQEKKNAAHTILGSARGLGAWKVAEEAAMFEETCARSSDSERLCDAVSTANDYIRELMN